MATSEVTISQFHRLPDELQLDSTKIVAAVVLETSEAKSQALIAVDPAIVDKIIELVEGQDAPAKVTLDDSTTPPTATIIEAPASTDSAAA